MRKSSILNTFLGYISLSNNTIFIFQEWSKRLKSKVEVLNNMEEVPQPSHSCQCHFRNSNLRVEL